MMGRPFTLGGAGEVQCPINEVQGESNSSPAISDREFQFHQHSSPLHVQQQPQYGQLFRPPPLFGNNTNSSFLNFSGLSADLGLETLRNEQQNAEMFEKSSNFSPLKVRFSYNYGIFGNLRNF
jgi:hypothetical protein